MDVSFVELHLELDSFCPVDQRKYRQLFKTESESPKTAELNCKASVERNYVISMEESWREREGRKKACRQLT